MANATETTFKDWQADERYKKLERTLKMVLLRNAESKGTDNASCAWPSISSINGDNLDTSCAAMSIQSSRIGSEVVSSSSNLKNIMMNKKQFIGPRNNIATSSENQFPTNKRNIEDSAMMPPPRTPGPSFPRSKTSGGENPRTPLLNIALNLDRNDNNFVMSTPTSGVSPVSKCPGLPGVNSSTAFGKNNDYHCNNTCEKSGSDARAVQAQERIFSRWRVLLNDKGQLIIKGTLECGKIARSKPVIRRLTPTSVQSIFKHTYHLRGNLVDERNELPDYVSGKFYNGFPEDWENVYQVWRNYVSEGSRLSFRWPTPITDSDDDIKSGITEISYYPSIVRHKKSRSPKKRSRSSNTLSTTLPLVENNENNLDEKRCACSQVHNASDEIPLQNSMKLSTTFLQNRSRDIRLQDSPALSDSKADKSRTLHETSTMSYDNNRKFVGNTLKDIIQEDKINMIIDNLTNKNCSYEYIHKIVEMFDCMKYVVSYQSTGSNDSEKIDSASNTPKESPAKRDRSMEKTNDRANSSHRSTASIDRHENSISREINASSTKIIDKTYSPRYGGEVRRKLIKNDYDSPESDNDYYERQRKVSIEPRSSSNEIIRDMHRYKDWQSSSARLKRPYHDSERSSSVSHVKYRESQIPESKRNDSSLSEDEFPLAERSTQKNRISSSPGKSQILRDRRNTDPYDSSISITEDDNDECYRKKEKAKNERKKYYDSSVSITEDERDDVRTVRGNPETLKYYPELKSHPVEPDVRKMEDLQNDRQRIKYYPELNSRPIDTETGMKNPRKITTFLRSMVTDEHRLAGVIDSPTKNRSIDNFASKHPEDSSYISTDAKRQMKFDTVVDMMETESNKFRASSNEMELQRNFETRELSHAKTNIPHIRKKPVIVNTEMVNINLRGRNWKNSINGNENDRNADNTTNKRFESNAQISQRSSVNVLPECAKIPETTITRSGKKEANIKIQESKSSTPQTICENIVEPAENSRETFVAKFGSEENPKQLTGWVPAVICDSDDDHGECHLIFEGKLINEAGHVVSRKFTTDFVKRRLSPKLIETVDHVFYRLVGDLNDTKRVVPTDLIKLCRTGCPSKISNFCEKWKLSLTGSNEISSKLRPHNTSVDCLSVPTSSRGRRIVPPLNYWDGERITTKDNKAIYSPGNCLESSIPSSLEKTNDEISDKRISPQKIKGKRTEDSAANGTKKKGSEKILSPTAGVSSGKKPAQPRGLQATRNNKRRLAKKLHESSSESDEEGKTRPVLRKRKTRVNDFPPNTDTTSTRQLRNTSRNTTSSQSLDQSANSRSGSFEKSGEPEIKPKLRKRQKLDEDEGKFVVPVIAKQLTTGETSGVTCTFYKNVPLRDGDLSEDQLSTM